MKNASELEQVLDLALKLAPNERLQLIEHIALSVERDIETNPSRQHSFPKHWGESILQKIDEIDMTDWTDIDIDDAVEWVNEVRKMQVTDRKLNWEGNE